MSVLRVILRDQLSMEISSLRHCDKTQDYILICEVLEELITVKHHKKKLAFVLSAMRHFAHKLLEMQYNLAYIKLENHNNTGSLSEEVRRIVKEENITKIVITQPSEYHTLKAVKSWQGMLLIPVEILEDDRFLCSHSEFKKWSEGRKELRMEYFYREMRRKYDILMEDGKPVGNRWNYDSENRKTYKDFQRDKKQNNHSAVQTKLPLPYQISPDHITTEVVKLVSKKFSTHFGALEPFRFAVTEKQAREALEHFIEERLGNFGNYQDIILQGEPLIYHSHLSMYINCGLLNPLECIQSAERAYYEGKVSINAAEGFIRQILGWREYIRGIYWLKMPEYLQENYLNATRTLPNLYWTAQTKMNCLKQCVLDTQKYAHAHHIQRLMVLGNFALLVGVAPRHINEWFLIVYTDAYEWVELPNVSGMALFADGGYLASKPYAASGSYINKMSDYCKNCQYDVDQKSSDSACPFNYLYWNFLIKNQSKIQMKPRMTVMYKTLEKMDDQLKRSIIDNSAKFLTKMEEDKLV